MQILNSTIEDIDTIFKLYDAAVAYQKTVFHRQWQPFDRELIEQEIKENRQWKIMIGDEVAAIFAITFNDPKIWGEKDKDAAIYIHRIVTNPAFRGAHFVKAITAWAKHYAATNQLDYVRMDTWADNDKLREYYVSCGFAYLGTTEEMSSENLPKHYDGIRLSLFEIKV